MPHAAYIYDAIRTPRSKGKKDGSLHEVKPVDLGAGLLRALNTPVAGLQRARLRVRRQYSTKQMVDGAWQVYATHLPHAW